MKTSHFAALLAGALLLTPILCWAQEEPIVGIDNRDMIGSPQGSPVTDPELTERTEALTSLMRCPVCQGLSIADSGTMIALAMKEEVRQFIAEGYTDEQILLYFEASYGEFIRLAPKATGFNLTVWIAPLVALLIGVFVVMYRLRAKPVEAKQEVAPEEDLAEYRERVRQEISS